VFFNLFWNLLTSITSASVPAIRKTNSTLYKWLPISRCQRRVKEQWGTQLCRVRLLLTRCKFCNMKQSIYIYFFSNVNLYWKTKSIGDWFVWALQRIKKFKVPFFYQSKHCTLERSGCIFLEKVRFLSIVFVNWLKISSRFKEHAKI